MRGTQCNRDTFKVAGGRKPTKIKMFVAYLKKCMGVHSPCIPAKYAYEYDYLKARYFGGKKNG